MITEKPNKNILPEISISKIDINKEENENNLNDKSSEDSNQSEKNDNFSKIEIKEKSSNFVNGKSRFFNNFAISNDKTSIKSNNKKSEEIDVFNQKNMEDSSILKYKTINKILNDNYFNLIINIFTLYALFGEDLRILLLPKSVDIYFNSLTLICMILFIIEIIFSIFINKEYLFSFFFWLDLLSTLTLVLDLSWISELFASSTY